MKWVCLPVFLQGAGHDSSGRQGTYLRFLASQWHRVRSHYLLSASRLHDRQQRVELDRSSKDTFVTRLLRPAVRDTPPGTPIVLVLG